MFKKILAALLASAMVISCLAACNKAADEKTEAEKTTEAAKEDETEADTEAEGEDETEAPAGDAVKITVFRCLYNRQAVNDEQVKKVQDKVNELLADRGAKVEIEIHEIHSSEYADKCNLALANNEINLLWNASWWSTIGTDDIWRQNAAYDITELVKGTMLWDSMPEGIWQASTYDGKVLFVPVYKESYEGYDIRTRKALMEECGWTEEELANVHSMEALEPYVEDAANAGVKYPFDAYQMNYRWLMDYYDWINDSSCFFAIDRKTNEPVVGFETPEYIDLCKRFGKWYDNGWISDDFVTNNVPQGLTQTQDWAWEFWTCVPGDELANAEERDQQEEYIVQGFTEMYVHSTTTLGSCYTITNTNDEEHAKACIEFLGYLYTDEEIADAYTFGIEGEDWEMVDGRVKQNPDSLYNHSAWESTSVMALTLIDTEPEDKKEDYKAKNEAAQTSIAAGFRFDKSDVDLNAKYTACKDINSEYALALETGGFGEDAVDDMLKEYRAALDGAGFQDVWQAFADQYNAWKAE